MAPFRAMPQRECQLHAYRGPERLDYGASSIDGGFGHDFGPLRRFRMSTDFRPDALFPMRVRFFCRIRRRALFTSTSLL